MKNICKVKHYCLLSFLAIFAVANAEIGHTTEHNYEDNARDGYYDRYGYYHKKKGKQATPDGYEKYFLFVADGAYDPILPHPNENIIGCVQGICDGEYFQKEIMKRSDEEIAEVEAKAIHFFKRRFGLDANDPANAQRLFLAKFLVDPRLNYHVISASKERVPSEGWAIRDGGWALVVIDPNGIELGGEFAGQTVDQGAQFLFGEYNIKTDKRKKNKKDKGKSKNIVIEYSSLEIGLPVTLFPLRCEVNHPKYGTGAVQGRWEVLSTPNGLKANVVTAVLFPELSED